MSSGRAVDLSDDGVVDVVAGLVTMILRVVSLGGEGVAELDGGAEEGAGLADRFVSASEVFWPGAVAVSK